MVDTIYKYLKSPKTIKELSELLNEEKLNWNEYQIKLFLDIDKNIKNDGELYYIESYDKIDLVLEAIATAIGTKPVIPIIKVKEYIKTITVSEEEILKIALKSGRYEVLPNGKVLKRIN